MYFLGKSKTNPFLVRYDKTLITELKFRIGLRNNILRPMSNVNMGRKEFTSGVFTTECHLDIVEKFFLNYAKK